MKNKLTWGLFFIGAAGLIIANQLGYLININWLSLLFTIILIPVIVRSIPRLEFFGIFIPISLILIIYKKYIGMEDLTTWSILIAAVFLSIGFSILFKRRKYEKRFKEKEKGNHFEEWRGDANEKVEYDDDSVVDCNVSLGGTSKYIYSSDLKEVNIYCHLGGAKVYFDNTKLHNGRANINIDCLMGAIEFYIPKEWDVVNNIDMMLSALDEKNRGSQIREGVIELNGSMRLAGIEICYI